MARKSKTRRGSPKKPRKRLGNISNVEQESDANSNKQRRSSAKGKVISNLCEETNDDFIQNDKIEKGYIPTHQGRNSTHGCVVIAELIVNRHVKSSESISDVSVADVIDNESPPIIYSIRKKLGLNASAYIDPTDVIDYLTDQGKWNSSMFVDASIGNVLDQEHLDNFLESLERGKPGVEGINQTTGATFYFNEHVVSILKIRLGPEKVVYDLVDSLPYSGEELGSRIRCQDLQSLSVALKWHAFQRFSASNLNWIENRSRSNNGSSATCGRNSHTKQLFFPPAAEDPSSIAAFPVTFY